MAVTLNSKIAKCATGNHTAFIWKAGKGTFIGNTLSDNAKGAWCIGDDEVVRTDNVPNE